MGCAFVASLGVFATFFLSVNYLSAFIQLPGMTALSALSDRFLFIVASITLSALAPLIAWEALALESRDAAILGPLPIEARTITRAKLCATLIVGGVVVALLNAVPSVLYPSFMTFNLRGITGSGLLRLIGGHAVTMTMAGLCGFFGVLALRGLLRATFGERRFTRVSSLVQSALIAVSVAALLLAATVNAATIQDWVGGTRSVHSATPALWFLGLNETVAGHIVAEMPMVAPGTIRLSRPFHVRDAEGRAKYRALAPRFADLARAAVIGVLSLASLAIMTFLWNNRRFPDKAVSDQRPSRARVLLAGLVERLTHRNREAQASFFFTLQILTRSGPHRMIVAVAAAAAAAFGFIAIVSGSLASQFALQTLVLASLLAGFRYAVTVPAELASNWTIQMAWLGDERGYLTGVRRAEVAALIVVPLMLLLPIHVGMFGLALALVHSAWGSLCAVAVLDALFLTYRRLPFACSYVPMGNLKLVWPLSVASGLIGAFGFAGVEQAALTYTAGNRHDVRMPRHDRGAHQGVRPVSAARQNSHRLSREACTADPTPGSLRPYSGQRLVQPA